MIHSELSTLRLINQQLIQSRFDNPKELVEWMGAIQAQDLQMSLLAIVLRMQNPRLKVAEEALNSGEILRTHIMRPTWHLVSRDDIYWMLELTTPSLIRLSDTRNRQLELTNEILSKSYRILEKELEGKELSREKIDKMLKDQDIRTDENRLSHILCMAEYKKLITSGTVKGNRQNYVLFDDRVPIKKTLTREESIIKLTERYFQSHGPATIADFAWWSFLPLKEIRWALKELKDKFFQEKVGDEIYYFTHKFIKEKSIKNSIHLLPAFDEFLISYKSKHVYIADHHLLKVTSTNGLFRPIIIMNGEIIGLWKYGSSKNKKIEISLFAESGKEINLPSEKIEFILKNKFL
ncbi:MAG: winged helix DNA-binding domain-containing protein [Paludibacteraceae bacterium]